MSTQLPKLENEGQVSFCELAATVMAPATLAGSVLQASVPVLPAATTKARPWSVSEVTALFK